METKFHLLAVGQQFEWEGKSYVKTTPLIASQTPEGGQRFIPKSAMVTVLGQQPAVPAQKEPTEQLDSHHVRQAVARYHQRCLEVSAHPQQDAEIIDGVRKELEQVYRDLLDELKLS